MYGFYPWFFDDLASEYTSDLIILLFSLFVSPEHTVVKYMYGK